jgi:hypothetical protein
MKNLIKIIKKMTTIKKYIIAIYCLIILLCLFGITSEVHHNLEEQIKKEKAFNKINKVSIDSLKKENLKLKSTKDSLFKSDSINKKTIIRLKNDSCNMVKELCFLFD